MLSTFKTPKMVDREEDVMMSDITDERSVAQTITSDSNTLYEDDVMRMIITVEYYDPWSSRPSDDQELYEAIGMTEPYSTSYTDAYGELVLIEPTYPAHVLAGYQFREEVRSRTMASLDDFEDLYQSLFEDLALPSTSCVVKPKIKAAPVKRGRKPGTKVKTARPRIKLPSRSTAPAVAPASTVRPKKVASSTKLQKQNHHRESTSLPVCASASASTFSALIEQQVRGQKRKMAERVADGPALFASKIHEVSIRRQWAQDKRRKEICDSITDTMCRVRDEMKFLDDRLLRESLIANMGIASTSSAPANATTYDAKGATWERAARIAIIEEAKEEIQRKVMKCDDDVRNWIEEGRAREPRKRSRWGLHKTSQRYEIKSKDGAIRYVCVWCENTYALKGSLVEHIRAAHLDFHISFCDGCNQFSSPRTLVPVHQCAGDNLATNELPSHSDSHQAVLASANYDNIQTLAR